MNLRITCKYCVTYIGNRSNIYYVVYVLEHKIISYQQVVLRTYVSFLQNKHLLRHKHNNIIEYHSRPCLLERGQPNFCAALQESTQTPFFTLSIKHSLSFTFKSCDFLFFNPRTLFYGHCTSRHWFTTIITMYHRSTITYLYFRSSDTYNYLLDEVTGAVFN